MAKTLQEVTRMKIIDLTHTITENMTVYPGTEEPRLVTTSTQAEDGFKETLIHLFSHVGTHMDAPQHVCEDGISLDRMDAESFAGTGLVIDATSAASKGTIDMSYINKNREKADAVDFILFKTGWDKFWNSKEYFKGYPVISDEVAEYLVNSLKKGVGFDTLGIDTVEDEKLHLHHKLLDSDEMVIIENLCNLDLVGEDIFIFLALPLKYENSDGAPARVVAMV